MSGKTKLFLLFFACLLTMCTQYTSQVIYANELSCQDYTRYRFFERGNEGYEVYIREEGRNCTYTCSDGTVKEMDISGVASGLISSSKEELDVELCDSALPPSPTPMDSLLTVFPISSATPTSAATRTATGSPAVPSIRTITATVSSRDSVLTGTVTMCDLGGKLINFRIAQPPQDITGRSLEVQIADRDSTCYVNPTNRFLLTCSLPVGVSFPANIVVSLDGTVVDDFEYSGLGCAVLTTQTPGPRPINTNQAPTLYP